MPLRVMQPDISGLEPGETKLLNKLIITTYHSSKGLENNVCILLNIDWLDNRKLIYVGLTRASEKLYVHSREQGNVFKELRSCYMSVDD
ncbi:ATP-binding domain-containing protein [Methanomethylovorans sp.]|uniref:ATP-binding domain-containing protein n=1 Tax=Methanomethylovorans sp. TaxID=2758717 RepID=UPI00351BF556